MRLKLNSGEPNDVASAAYGAARAPARAIFCLLQRETAGGAINTAAVPLLKGLAAAEKSQNTAARPLFTHAMTSRIAIHCLEGTQPMSTFTCFNVETKNKVAHIQLKRGSEFNTMTRAFWNELPAIVGAINDEASARAIVISSTGKHFSAGMDLSVFTDGSGAAGEASSSQTGRKAEHGRARANLRLEVHRLQKTFGCLDLRFPARCVLQFGMGKRQWQVDCGQRLANGCKHPPDKRGRMRRGVRHRFVFIKIRIKKSR